VAKKGVPKVHKRSIREYSGGRGGRKREKKRKKETMVGAVEATQRTS